LDESENAPRGLNQAVEQNTAEVMKRATIHFDGGGQSPGPVTAACTVELSHGSVDQAVTRFDQGTHNTAEWHALILGLRMALKHGERHVVVKGDSMLVVKQINREWKTKNAALRSLRAQAEELLARFETWRVEWIPRKENRRTDELGRAQCAPGSVRALASTALRTRGVSAHASEGIAADMLLIDFSLPDRRARGSSEPAIAEDMGTLGAAAKSRLRSSRHLRHRGILRRALRPRLWSWLHPWH
jgi:ribonuclease HI